MQIALWATLLLAGDVTQEDVIRLAKAKVSDELIITFLTSKDARFDLSAEDVIALKAGGVSEGVITHMLMSDVPGPKVLREPPPARSTAPATVKKTSLPPPPRALYDTPRSSYIPVRGPIFYAPRYCYPGYRAYCYPKYSHGYCGHH